MKASVIASILSLCLAGYAKAACVEGQCDGLDLVTDAVESDNEFEVNIEADNVDEVDSGAETESPFPRGQGMQFFTQCKNPNHWAMTYDDGPTQYTDLMLDLFNKYNIKVTFFVCGNLHINVNDPEWARIIKRMHDEGHLIGNHTFNHVNLSDLSAEEITSEMKQVEDAVYNVIGKRPAFMRLPFGAGASVPTVMDALAANGYNAAINWNVDTVDWGNTGDIEYAKQVITEQLGNPIITLNHLQFDGITNENIAALASAEIEYLLSQGYTPVRMDECLGMAPYQE